MTVAPHPRSPSAGQLSLVAAELRRSTGKSSKNQRGTDRRYLASVYDLIHENYTSVGSRLLAGSRSVLTSRGGHGASGWRLHRCVGGQASSNLSRRFTTPTTRHGAKYNIHTIIS